MQTFKVGDRELKLGPFTIEQAEEALTILEQAHAGVQGGDTETGFVRARRQRKQMQDVIVIGLRHTEPDAASAGWIAKNVIFRDLESLYMAILEASGLGRKEPAEGEAKGP